MLAALLITMKHSSEPLSFEYVSLRCLTLVQERSHEVTSAHERIGVMLAKNPLTSVKHISCDTLRLVVLALAQERTDEVTGAHERIGVMVAENPPTRRGHLPNEQLCLCVLTLHHKRHR